MSTVMVVIGYVVIGFFEIVPLYQNKQKKEMTLYVITFTFAFIISLLLSLGVEIPSPAKPIQTIVEMIIGKGL